MGLVAWAQWARAAKLGRPGVVVAVSGQWVSGLADLCPQVRLQGVEQCPRTGRLFVWLVNADDLLLLVPEPAARGSETEGNLLPW